MIEQVRLRLTQKESKKTRQKGAYDESIRSSTKRQFYQMTRMTRGMAPAETGSHVGRASPSLAATWAAAPASTQH